MIAVLIIAISVVLFSDMACAGGQYHRVEWEALNLSPGQQLDIERLNTDWQRVYDEHHSQLTRDRQRMKELLRKPEAPEEEVTQLQQRIHQQEMMLRSQALKYFMHKKKVLTPGQQQHLHQMMFQQER
jgi:Spy/CpxP family protein refolding chaperone